MSNGLQLRLELFGTVKRQGDWYVAHCPPLDITTQGRTEREAKQNLQEASELFLTSCLERGTLDQALRELGWVPAKSKPRPRNSFAMPVAVPFSFASPAACPA
jgi:predicted RNase H-like HicB family nuclease